MLLPPLLRQDYPKHTSPEQLYPQSHFARISMTGDVWKIEGRFKKKVKYYPLCARNLRKEVKRYTVKRPKLPEQSIHNMADHQKKQPKPGESRKGCPKSFIFQ